MKQWLEMEIGITGGEEDGVNNEDVDNNSLYTQPEDIYDIYKALSAVSPYFSKSFPKISHCFAFHTNNNL
jgi:fructose-bisphosphate aldolase class II